MEDINYDQHFAEITNPDDLYRALVAFIDPILQREGQMKDAIQAEYDADTKPFLDEYLALTAPQKAVADEAISVQRDEFKAAVKKITDAAMKRIDKLTKGFDTFQQGVIAQYTAQTLEAQARYDSRVADKKQWAEEQLEKFAQVSTTEIEPINAAYRKRALELDIPLQ